MEYQFNKVTGKVYEGNNQGELQVAKQKNNYKSNEWLTFLQAKDLNLKIKKGSKSVGICKGFGSFTEKDEKGKIKSVSRPLGFANVFNLDVCEKIINKQNK
jgi:antirestriction protein ArdC